MELTAQDTATISVLYVEDDICAREFLLSMLRQHYPETRFITADNGLHGLEEFSRCHPPIVITDISMPGMDGISMAARMKELAPETIIIALTAHSETDHLLQAIETGINHYVLKPLDFKRVCAVIEQSIAIFTKEQKLRRQYQQICELNEALTAKTEDLECLNKELEAFNYTVAHDLRSPLVSISGFSQYLLEKIGPSLDETNHECLQTIYNQALRMNGLIDALLNFSRYSRQQIIKKWTDCSRIANVIRCNLLLHEPQRHVTFNIAEGVNGFADPVLLAVVLENLLNNAWKYSAKSCAACIDFGSTTMGDELVYYVRDNGCGFAQQYSANLFVPFQRLQGNEDIKGFGIGLATVSRIIQRHGGRIWADGEEGRGATFYFTL